MESFSGKKGHVGTYVLDRTADKLVGVISQEDYVVIMVCPKGSVHPWSIRTFYLSDWIPLDFQSSIIHEQRTFRHLQAALAPACRDCTPSCCWLLKLEVLKIKILLSGLAGGRKIYITSPTMIFCMYREGILATLEPAGIFKLLYSQNYQLSSQAYWAAFYRIPIKIRFLNP